MVRCVGVPSSSIPSLPHSLRPAPVVVGGHKRLRELLAEPAGVDAGALLHGVGLETVADRLVQQHAAEGVADHHREPPRGRVDGVELGERAPGGLLGHLLGVGRDQLPARVAAAGVAAGLHAPVAARHHLGAEPHAGAVVVRGPAVGAEHLDLSPSLHVADARLGDLGRQAARVLVAGAQNVGLAADLHLLRADLDRVDLRHGPDRLEAGRSARLAPKRLGSRLRHPQQVLLGQPVHVAVVGRVALHHPHAGAQLAPALRPLHATVVERDREAPPRFRVQLGEVPAAGQRALEHACGERGVDEARSARARLGHASRLTRRGLASASDSSTSSTIRSAVCSRRS